MGFVPTRKKEEKSSEGEAAHLRISERLLALHPIVWHDVTLNKSHSVTHAAVNAAQRRDTNMSTYSSQGSATSPLREEQICLFSRHLLETVMDEGIIIILQQSTL